MSTTDRIPGNIFGPMAIPPVSLQVARSPEKKGRSEHFHSARPLLARLEVIGAKSMVILSMFEGGREVPPIYVSALNHYLRAGKGLKYFRRICKWSDAASWRLLKSKVGLPANVLGLENVPQP